MTEIKLTDLFQQVKELMTEYGIGDNTLFVKAECKQHSHIPGQVETVLNVSMFMTKEGYSSSDIESVTGSTIKGILMQIEGKLMDRKVPVDLVVQL